MELKNMRELENIVEEIVVGSIAEELEIEPGDILLSINNKKVKDIIDYKFLVTDEFIILEIQKPNGDIWEYEIEKEFDEDLGIIFTNPLIDRAKNCRNKCIFCFIDQLPPNMRETLYFKDDDSRLSFLQGNFITLTNMSDAEIDRIIDYRLSPINISVHTTNPELRVRMLKNKNAGKIFEILKKFHQAKLEVNCQIVLVPQVNDGDELERTILDLSSLYPTVKSVAIVPIGITKYREKLEEVKSFDSSLSNVLLDYIDNVQVKLLHKLGTRFVFLSDEFFAITGRPLPLYNEYENFPQLENGVGLMKLFEAEILEELDKMEKVEVARGNYVIATGTLAYEYMRNLSSRIMDKFKGLNLEVKPILNNYFGNSITVSGLITGIDLINQLKELEMDGLIIPKSMLKSDEDIFLDNLTIMDVSQGLNTKVLVSKVSGKDFIEILKTEVGK